MAVLKDLLQEIPYTCVSGNVNIEVTDVVYDSRKVTKGCLFICISGFQIDGHEFAKEALEKGAAALVVEKEVDTEAYPEASVIKVENSRYAMAFLAAAWFGHPARELSVIGITGTKGKSTTSYLVKTILEEAGYKVGLIGTIEIIIGEERIHSVNTTPESFLLQQYFRQMKEAGCDVVVMEAASQGFKLYRTQGFVFDIGLFTNIEPDHIGPNEHEDFEEYLECKSRLFRQCRIGLVNRDDPHWEQLIKEHTCKLETFGLSKEADLYADGIGLLKTPGSLGVEFHAGGLLDAEVQIGTPGRFSVYNALAAIGVCRHFKVTEEQMKRALPKASVKGRIEKVEVSPDFTVLIDYAHNAMSLKSLLGTLKEYEPHRLICLFGCGGNRSKLRRYEMGEVSGSLADLTIITSDNPRFEEPLAIIEDIKQGIGRTKGEFVEIPDRKEAITYAITHAEKGDLIVLAGKGHEDYQEIKGVRYPMDERDLIQEILKELGWKEDTHM